ncbi:uncharacterized protein YjdB [Virgibacillus halotolerans]|uniref:Ig-like domain-containing protein n=1 Tax=Virgibacillus halotolerans TaxID=1071053 RepID=UPI001961F20B|nr:Ig-like domain-containing protein [Virgibacillus halotolerans]MBM7598088.1 uncharacterized protein YjdB [Virgibacillus halotolerans]
MSTTYNVYRDGKKIATGLPKKSYLDKGLTPNTTYKYQVSSVNNVGESDLSEAISVETNYSDVVEVKVDKNQLDLNIGDTESLNATVSPSTAQKGVKWESSDGSVVTVSDGNIEAVAEGIAEITVSSTADSSKRDTCEVTVVEPEPEPEPEE